ncbi:MAG: hypothetical protein IKR05_06970 [Prevotella sp.]|nr:hypothetical protein [Prevotella sp.]
MKNKLLFLIVMLTITFNMTYARVNQFGEPIVMSEKVTNPSGTHGEPHKSPDETLCIYQNDNYFYFGESFYGCAVTLLFNNVTVFSTAVDENGQVFVPTTLTGVFELQIIVDGVVYWAEVIL